MNQHLAVAASGAVVFGYLVIALCFARFWQQTRARLFLCFAVAFLILAVERVFIIFQIIEAIHQPLIYFTRLVAFLVIAWAIWDTNRPR